MAHRKSVGCFFSASLRLWTSTPSFFFGSARLLSSSPNTPSDEVDFLSRKRKQTEEKLEDLTEEGWEKKTPKQAEGAAAAAAAAENNNKEEPEVGGPKGPEPTRYGDWERAGRCSDF
jgi:hypothetical protein